MNVSQMFLERVAIIPGLFSMIIGKRTETERKRELNQDFCKTLHRVTRTEYRKRKSNVDEFIKVTSISYDFIEKFIREN